ALAPRIGEVATAEERFALLAELVLEVRSAAWFRLGLGSVVASRSESHGTHLLLRCCDSRSPVTRAVGPSDEGPFGTWDHRLWPNGLLRRRLGSWNERRPGSCW